MRVLSLLLLSLALACASPAPPPPPTATTAREGAPAGADAALGQRVDAALDAAIAEARVVGAVVVVLRDGRPVYRRAVGLADREGQVRMRESTQHRYASLTKPIVAAAALALVDAGKLRLDDPVTRWLPDFAPKLASGQAPVITVRHLLTHTSGLGYGFLEPVDGPYHRAKVSDGMDQPGLSFAENARRLASVPLLAEPGTAFIYSLSTDVLGEVVARAAGSTLPEAVASLVTRPLGMTDTGFGVTDRERLAVPYADAPQGAPPTPVRMVDGQRVPLFGTIAEFAPSRVFDARSYPSGGAGMVGTADDFVKLLESLRTHDGRVLKAETSRASMANQIGELRAPILGPGWGFGYGGAVMLDPAEAGEPLSRGSVRWGGAYGHMWFVDPVERLTVVLLTNTTFEGMVGKVTRDLTRAVYGR